MRVNFTSTSVFVKSSFVQKIGAKLIDVFEDLYWTIFNGKISAM